MRLINVHTRLFEDFASNWVPDYAILSHTWEQEEVTYSHYISGNYQSMRGYGKIDMTCRIAAQDGLSYAWVDTCCIDKSSSAELSEAINSMFQWYELAELCYVYLSDLPLGVEWTEWLSKCRWFTRGWTLQELIAPSDVIFFDSAWSEHGSPLNQRPDKKRLAQLLSSITGIDRRLLDGRTFELETCSVAQRLSWASHRETTRPEDMAYCLLGLFDINMPLLYGEGHKAFVRLQQEIIRSTADLSILAWSNPGLEKSQMMVPPERLSETTNQGILAPSVLYFAHSGEVINGAESSSQEQSITNIGLKLRTRVYLDNHARVLILPLHCVSTATNQELAVALLHIGQQRYLRIDSSHLVHYHSGNLEAELLAEIYLLTKPIPSSGRLDEPITSIASFKFHTRLHALHIVSSATTSVHSPWPQDSYDRADQTFFVNRNRSQDICTFGVLIVSFPNGFIHHFSVVAVGWADSTPYTQFGILLSNDHGTILENLKKAFDRRHFTGGGRKEFLSMLKHYGIPRAKSIHVPMDGTDQVLVLAIEPMKSEGKVLRRDPKRRSTYYELSVVKETYDAQHAPPIETDEWEVPEW